MKIVQFVGLLGILPAVVFANDVKEEKEQVDMADPTAVYSSVGAHLYTDGSFDLSAGLAWGKNVLAVESKSGFDAVNVRYAQMNIWNGIGVYAESTVQIENESGTTASIGAVGTYSLNKVWTAYPILTLGSAEHIEDDWIATSTAGVYNRFKLGSGFSLGVDPFYTFGEDNYESISVDTFINYQHKNHQVRVGFTGSESNTVEFGGEGYVEYKMAF